jgi:hypothetical protein
MQLLGTPESISFRFGRRDADTSSRTVASPPKRLRKVIDLTTLISIGNVLDPSHKLFDFGSPEGSRRKIASTSTVDKL